MSSEWLLKKGERGIFEERGKFLDFFQGVGNGRWWEEVSIGAQLKGDWSSGMGFQGSQKAGAGYR